MSAKIPTQNLKKGSGSIPSIEIASLNTKTPLISFQFINGMNGGCLKSLCKKQKTEATSMLQELQLFINEFSKLKNISEACMAFSGKKLNINKSNDYVNNIIKKLHKNYPELSGIIKDELSHVHAKKGGKGKTVYFGFQYENIFNIIYIDPNHDFDK